MKVKDLRQKTSEELKKMLAEKQEELLNLRFEIANRKLKDFSRVEKGRKMIARILTIVRERELQEGTAKQKPPVLKNKININSPVQIFTRKT